MCAGIVKIYRTPTGEVHALKGIDAVFPSGAMTAVVGPSGSGKSSLLRILAGFDSPTAGSVEVGGVELAGLGRIPRRRLRRRRVGYVFQRPADNLIPHLTVAQHLEVAARLRGIHRRSAIRDETARLLEALGMEERAGNRPSQLSGGEQQRVAFAQAIVGNPAVVLADEPTAELDSVTGKSLLRLVEGAVAAGTAFIVATHDPLVVRLASRRLHLRHGALEAETRDARTLSVIDESGRIQLPPRALRLFRSRRAMLEIQDGEVRITPP